MSFGVGGSYPVEYGGGDGGADRIRSALRVLLGNAAPPEGGVLGLWMSSKSRAIDLAARLMEHAVMQVWPESATTGIPRWETLLGLPGDGYDVERVEEILVALTTEVRNDAGSIGDDLRSQVSPHLTVASRDRALSRVVQPGRLFGAWGSEVAPLRMALFSDEYVWRVVYELQTGEIAIPEAIVRDVRAFMHDRISAWEDYELVTDNGGVIGFWSDGANNSLTDQTLCY